MIFDAKKYAEKKRTETNAMTIGLNFAAGVGFFFYMGHLADNSLGYVFTFKLIGLFLGLIGATIKLIKDVRKLDGREQNKR